MATATPTRAPDRRTQPKPVYAEHIRKWLNHPMASVYLIVVPTVLLLGIGTLMVWSASTVFAYTQFGNGYYFLKRHVIFLGLGIVAAFIVSRFSTERLRSMGWLILGVSALLILLTFVPGIGVDIKGNRNWIDLVPGTAMVRLQPSEFAKLAIIAWGATVFVAKERLLKDARHIVVPFVPGSLMVIGLVLLQKDLGTAMILGAIMLAVLWFVGAPGRVLLGMSSAIALGVGVLVYLEPGRMARIFGFLDQSSDLSGVNHQPQQAIYGLATGGWWGVGLGASRMKWGKLVEAHTDFVLAIIGEELGVWGTLMVLFLLLAIGYAGFRIALRTTSTYTRLLAAGITSWLMIQALVNVFVVLRWMPVLGVPLPLVSYGGSALLSTMLGLGVLVACAREEPGAKAWLARRRKKKGSRIRLTAVSPAKRT